MPSPDRQTLARLRDDIELFAEHVVGEPLWPHQVELAQAPERIVAALCGRQSGKSRTLAVIATHEAFRGPKRRILIVSAGEAAARNLLAEIAQLCAAPALAGSVTDESTSLIRLSNGSTIRSVPASPRAIRGQSIDTLLLDEACFIDDAIWTAARFTVLARPGSRIVMASTPWGRQDRFFATTYRAGQRGVEGYGAHHWPSTVSPMVDETLLELFRATMTGREYRAEVLAEWGDAQGAYFSQEELDAGLALGGPEGSPLLAPEACFFGSCGRLEAEVGVDWGFARDANAAVAVAAVPTEMGFAGAGRLWVPWLIERYQTTYEDFIAELVAAAGTRGLRFRAVRAETNGVGAMPTQVLRRRFEEVHGSHAVEGLATTAATKAESFSAIKLLLQSERLVLPRYPALLRQMAALEFQETDHGGIRLSVPESQGHDDLVLALSFAFRPAVEEAKVNRAPLARVGHRNADGRVVWHNDEAIAEEAAKLLRMWPMDGPMAWSSEGERRAKAYAAARKRLGYGQRDGLKGTR